jgi:hypothetical protein
VKNIFGRVVLGMGALALGALLFWDAPAAEAQSDNNARRVYESLVGTVSETCANNPVDGGSGLAACTLSFKSPTVFYTCSDGDGCNVTLAEPSANYVGREMNVVNVGTNTVNFADTSGVSELAGSFAAGANDSLHVLYRSDRWVELGRSNN